MTVTTAQDSELWDGEGKRLIDFSSQMVNTNIGHQHPASWRPFRNGPGSCAIAPAHINDARSEPARLMTERALRHLEDVILLGGAGNIAALILEPIPGTAGI